MLAHLTKTEKRKHKFCVETVAITGDTLQFRHAQIPENKQEVFFVTLLLLSRNHWKDCVMVARNPL